MLDLSKFKITKESLCNLNACAEGLERFDALSPTGETTLLDIFNTLGFDDFLWSLRVLHREAPLRNALSRYIGVLTKLILEKKCYHLVGRMPGNPAATAGMLFASARGLYGEDFLKQKFIECL